MCHGRSSWSLHSHGGQGWFVLVGVSLRRMHFSYSLCIQFDVVQVGDDQFGRDAIQNFKDNKVNVRMTISVMTM